MRKPILFGLLLAAACRTSTVEVPAPAPTPAAMPVIAGPGASSSRGAVDAFLGAISSQNIDALSAVWGDKNGPVRESKTMPRADMEQRALYLMRCLKHDRYRILAESPAVDAERVFQVELVRGTLTRVTDLFTARGGDRWYVRETRMEPVRELCSAK